MAEGGAGAVQRQRGGVRGGVMGGGGGGVRSRVRRGVMRVRGGVRRGVMRGGVQCVRGGVGVGLQLRRRVLQDDHRPRLPLTLGVGVAPRWRIAELLEPGLCPRLEAGAGQPLPSGRGRGREEGGRRAGVEEEERRSGGGGG